MYTQFYNLRERPFDLKPSTRFLYLGETHKEALALLTYGIIERKGFVLLTGEQGIGKTAMVQKLVKGLDSSIRYVYLSNPNLSTGEFLYRVSQGLGFRGHVRSKGSFLVEFQHFVEKFFQHQQHVLLIIDDAHKLSFELLEEIRLLSNIEAADQKLITVLLIGRPELNEKLNQEICKSILQRISIRYHINPLDLKGTREYIATRLQAAGAENGHEIFSKKTIQAIHQYSQGYPRMINILAEKVLLLGYSKGLRKFNATMVRQCYQDIHTDKTFAKIGHQTQETLGKNQAAIFPLRSHWKRAAVLLMILVVAFAMGLKRWDIMGSLAKAIPVHFQADPTDMANQQGHSAKEDTNSVIQEVQHASNRVITYQKTAKAADKVAVMATVHASQQLESTCSHEEKPSSHAIIANDADNLTELAVRVYGWANKSILNLLQRNNPGIKNIDQIQAGQKVFFPPLLQSTYGSAYTVHIASYKLFTYAHEEFHTLINGGSDAYVIPVDTDQKGKVFRVTVGRFQDLNEARICASTILEKGISDYAQPIRMELKTSYQ